MEARTRRMSSLPTEPIGSIPRPRELIEAIRAAEAGDIAPSDLEPLYAEAVRDTIRRFEASDSPVVSDGEQRKVDCFATYCVHGAPNFAPDGFTLRFTDHERRWPRMTCGPFRYRTSAARYLAEARSLTSRPVKQAVISPSALSLMYPRDELDGYSRDEFVADLIHEHVSELRDCLAGGAHTVQIDFTEGRLAHKLDPSGGVLSSFVQAINMALDRLPPVARTRIGVHTCPGGDRDSTHSLDVDYAMLLPSLFGLRAARFFVALAREPDRPRVLDMIARLLQPGQQVYVGVVDPLDPRVETPEEVRDRLLEAAEYIAPQQLGSTDDCGYSPFSDDTSTSRDTAFAKIAARVLGTRLAAEKLARRGR